MDTEERLRRNLKSGFEKQRQEAGLGLGREEL